MSVQSVNNSTAALTSQWLQSQSSSLFGSTDVQSLPQLSGDQLQQLRQALQQDVQQAFAGQTSGGGANGCEGPADAGPDGCPAEDGSPEPGSITPGDGTC